MSNAEGMSTAGARGHQNARKSKHNRETYVAGHRPRDPVIYPSDPVERSVITEDLASFLIVNQVIVGGFHSVQELKDYFAGTPEVQDLVDHTLSGMEAAEMIAIKGDAIQCNTDVAGGGTDPREMMRYIPNLFRLAAKRVLKNEAQRPTERKRRKESVVYYTIPDDPKLAAKVHEFEMEFRAKVASLYEEAVSLNTSSKVRLVGVLDCVLEPEDFA